MVSRDAKRMAKRMVKRLLTRMANRVQQRVRIRVIAGCVKRVSTQVFSGIGAGKNLGSENGVRKRMEIPEYLLSLNGERIRMTARMTMRGDSRVA